jgi:hypothetical protein
MTYDSDDFDNTTPPAHPDRPDVRRCPGCWRAAFSADVTKYVHEVAPCYQDCHL